MCLPVNRLTPVEIATDAAAQPHCAAVELLSPAAKRAANAPAKTSPDPTVMRGVNSECWNELVFTGFDHADSRCTIFYDSDIESGWWPLCRSDFLYAGARFIFEFGDICQIDLFPELKRDYVR